MLVSASLAYDLILAINPGLPFNKSFACPIEEKYIFERAKLFQIMRAKHLLFLAFTFFLLATNLYAQPLLWSKAGDRSYASYAASVITALPEKFMLSKINLDQLKSILLTAPTEYTAGRFTKGVPFSILLPNKTVLSARVM